MVVAEQVISQTWLMVAVAIWVVVVYAVVTTVVGTVTAGRVVVS